jgi:hypothetical protein
MCFPVRLLRAIEPPDPQRAKRERSLSTASEPLDDRGPTLPLGTNRSTDCTDTRRFRIARRKRASGGRDTRRSYVVQSGSATQTPAARSPSSESSGPGYSLSCQRSPRAPLWSSW